MGGDWTGGRPNLQRVPEVILDCENGEESIGEVMKTVTKDVTYAG